MKKEENAWTEAMGIVKSLWRHRKGQEIVGAILDTFDNLGFITKDEKKPLLVGKRKTEYG